MYRIGIILLAMASLAAGGVLINRNRLGINTQQGQGIGLDSVQGLGLDRQGQQLSREELLRQKFILDILRQVDSPLQQQDLLQLGDGELTNEDLLITELDEDVLYVLDLIGKGQMLGKNTACSINNDNHIRQLLGMYRLYLIARDFQAVQRIAIYARRNLNAELFVNSLILALRERSDTKMLIIPALYEILPQLYQDSEIIQQIQSIGQQNMLNDRSIRPNLLDVITSTRQNRLLNSGGADLGMNIWNRAQLWMPWRQLHQELALRKIESLRNHLSNARELEGLVLAQPIRQGQGLFTQDMGLKSYLNIILDELIVQQSPRAAVNIGGLGSIIDNEVTQAREQQIREEIDNTETMQTLRPLQAGQVLQVTETRDENILGQGLRNRIGDIEGQTVQSDLQNREQSEDDINLNNNRLLILGRRRLGDIEDQNEQSGLQNRDILHGQDEDNVSLNDNRLLYVGRRRKNLGGISNSENRNILEDDSISGGRRVSNEDQDRDQRRGRDQRKQQQQRGMEDDRDLDNDLLLTRRRLNNANNDENLQQGQYLGINEGQNIQGINRDNRQRGTLQNERQDILEANRDNRQQGILENEREGNLGVNRAGRQWGISENNNNDNIDRGLYYRNLYGGQGRPLRDESNMGRGKQEFSYAVLSELLDEIERNQIISLNRERNLNQGMNLNRERNLNQGMNLNSELPTTSIDDDRLLHINRRRLNEIDEGRQVGIEQEGDRKYVDRDDDSGRGGRGNINNRGNQQQQDLSGNRRGIQQEGDRKYVDRDDDSGRGGRYGGNQQQQQDQINNRRGGINLINNRRQEEDMISIRGGIPRYGINQQDQEQDNINNRLGLRNNDSPIRYRRSLDNERSLNGRVFLDNLQQLVARINIERISLGQTQQLQDYLREQNTDELLIHSLNRLNNRGNNRLNTITIQKITDITQRLDQILQQQIQQISSLSTDEQLNQIGLIVLTQIRELGLLDILSENLRLNNQLGQGQLLNILDNQLNQLILIDIVRIINSNINNLPMLDRITPLQGIKINNVNLDRLRTYVDHSDVDLSNLLRTSALQSDNKNNMKLVVGSIPRLNHKSFKIDLDINSDRQQRVVVRTLLGPKTDASGKALSLYDLRQNFIILNVNSVDLQQGRNILQLKSSDIAWTSRDISTYMEIYQQVMGALNGNTILRKDLLNGQSNLLPHRLLIPQGRADGLPMQLLTVLTPIDVGAGNNQIGLESLYLDRLPLNYPLNSDLQDLNDQSYMFLSDVMIYHSNLRL